MVGLLGMMAAGAAIGARNASNQNVAAQNQLEIENAREQLREEYLNRRFDRELQTAQEIGKQKAAADEAKYQRDIEENAKQREHEIQKTGLLNAGKATQSEISGIYGYKAAKERADATRYLADSKKDPVSNKSITMPDGTTISLNSPVGKIAVDLMQTVPELKDNPQEAMRRAMAYNLNSDAARNQMDVMQDTVADKSLGMAGKYTGGAQQQPQQKIRTYKIGKGYVD